MMLRSGIEWLNEKRTTQRPWSSANYSTGFYREQYIKNQEYNNDALFTYKTGFGKFDVSASVGGSIRYNEYIMNDYRAEGLETAGVYSLTNAVSLITKLPKPKDKQVNSVYGLVNLNYDNLVFVDITGRNDWSSTLPKSNRSFFYPSVSTSFILSDIFDLKSSALTYWKLRGSWAEVGIDSAPYQLDSYYDTSDITGSVTSPTIYSNPNLKPEINTNIEGGMDFGLFRNRINFNFTLYQNVSENQIITVPMLYESGYSKRVINAGKIRNQGVELSMDAFAFKSNKFSWKIGANWSFNENRIMTLPDEFNGEPFTMASIGSVVYYNAVVGGSLGDLYGYKLVRNENGDVVFGSNGLTEQPDVMEKVGNAFPKWRAGLQNDFKLGNFTISFSFDGQYGGIAYSQTHHKMSEQGKLKSTLWGRDNADGMVIGEGVVRNDDGTYTENTTKISVSSYYKDYYRRANVETNSFSTDFIKLRDARIAYSFSKDLIQPLGIDNLTLAVFGKNLWMWTKFPIFDPEVATLNDSSITPGVEMGQLPSARTVGFQLNVKF